MEQNAKIREEMRQLMDNLSTVGLFMLGEVRSALNKGWGGSREEFTATVDRVANNMKQSSKIAAEDVERAAERIKKNWKVLDEQNAQEWQVFLDEMKNRLNAIGELSRETFDLSVEQTKKTLDRQWTSTGRLGDEQLKTIEKQTANMAELFKGQWNTFRDQMEKTGKRVDRALNAAWEELKK